MWDPDALLNANSADATLGHPEDASSEHPEEYDAVSSLRKNGTSSSGAKERTTSTGAKERMRRQRSGRPNFAPPNSKISVEHDRFLRVFRASADDDERPGKQITVVTERVDVCLGKKPEPGMRAPEVQKIKKLAIRLQTSDSHCKPESNEPNAKCETRPAEKKAVTSLADPALRVFCCPKCNRLIEYEIEAIPHIQDSGSVSIWDDFAIHVSFEQQHNVSSVFAVQALPDFVHILHSFISPDTLPIAVSQDMRLLAKLKTGGRDLGIIEPEAGPKIEISLVEKNLILQMIELGVGTAVNSLNFSSDGTMLLASMQTQRGDPTLVIWSTITGKEVRKVRARTGSTLLASFDDKSERVFMVELYRGGEKSTPMVRLEVLFLTTSPDLSENLRTDKQTIASSGDSKSFHDATGSSSWTSGNGEVSVNSTGEFSVQGEGLHSENGNILYHFASRVADNVNEAATRKAAFSLDHKKASTSKAHKQYLKILKSFANAGPVIRKASISQNGDVYAQVFETANVHQVHLPDSKTVLVWNLKTGFVSVDHVSHPTRLERSKVVVYSLITREVLWEIPLMHEVQETHLEEKSLLFEIDDNSESSGTSVAPSVFALPTSESCNFPCFTNSFASDDLVAELQLLHEIGDNLAVLTADELLAGLQSTTLQSYRSGAGASEKENSARRGSLAVNSYMKPISSQESWKSAAVAKRLVGLSVAGDGLAYVAKWAGEGEGGRAVWLSVGDVDWGRGVLVHRENFQLLEAGFEEHAQPEKIGTFCISNDGNIVACSIEGTCRVVVIWVPAHDDTSQEKILWEFDADVVPKALGIYGEKLSLMGDREMQVSFGVKENIVLTYSLVTRLMLHKVQHKTGGKTLGIDGSGELRVSMSQNHRVFLERFGTGEVLYEVFDHNLQFMGISGGGKRLIFKDTGVHHKTKAKCPCGMEGPVSGLNTVKQRRNSMTSKDGANHSLKQIDIPNFELFGPSKETCGTWMASGEMDKMFSVHKVKYEADAKRAKKKKLSFFAKFCSTPKAETKPLKAYPGRWSRTVSKLVREKDYDSVNLILEACPVMFACLVYTQQENVLEEIPDDGSDFLQHALANNDRLLVQLLLEGVKTIVGRDKGLRCPVTQMGHVTEFIIQCLKQSRMLDIVEQFLKDLPLIKVDESDVRKHVRAHFRRGRVISTGWNSRDAEALTGPWGLKDTTEEAEQKMRHDHTQSSTEEHHGFNAKNLERGYQYVVALPGLCDQAYLELVLSYRASPGLLDNESMRAATRVLEGDLQTRVLGIPMSGHFLAFLFCLACFCGFAELCVTPVQDDGFSKFSRDEIWGKDWGKAGIILGAVSTLLNLVFLVQELEEMANSRPIWTYFKPWNVIPWLSNLMAITNFIVFCVDSSNKTIRSTAGVAMILLWGTLFTFLRSVRKLSALVNMMIQIMSDMVMFILVVAVLLIAFAGGLYCLHGHIIPETERPGYVGEDAEDGGSSGNVFLWASDSIGRAFIMSVLQTFEVEELRSPLEPNGGGTMTNLSFLMFFGLVMLVSVVGMNALIAIMNNSYTRVAEREHSVRDKEVASVMLDKLRNFDKKTKYRWQKQRRWVHVLSPSEKGSLIQGAGNTVTEQIKREINAMETRTEFRFKHLLEVIKEYEEVNTENANMMRDLDSAARIGLQDTGNKQSKLLGMFKKLQDDQGIVHTEVKNLNTTVRGLKQQIAEQQLKSMQQQQQPAQVDLRGLENLPWQFKQLQQNQEIAMTQMATMQREMTKMLSQMQAFEWQITGVEQTARTTSAILAPLASATVEREDRVLRRDEEPR